MSKEVVGFKTGALQSFAGLEENLAQAATEISSNVTTGGKPILKFNSGDWVFGQEEYDVEEGSLWAADPTSYRWGWVRFSEEGKLLGDITVPITEKRPAKPEIPDDGEMDEYGKPIDWQEKYALELRCLTGEDEGAEVVYYTNTVGGRKLMSEFTTKLLNQVRKGNNRIVAVVELSGDSYKHKNKTYGTIHNPIFEYKEWREFVAASEDDDDAAADPAPEAQEEKEAEKAEAPKRGRKASAAKTDAAESEPAPEEKEDDAPKPRRRQRRQRQSS